MVNNVIVMSIFEVINHMWTMIVLSRQDNDNDAEHAHHFDLLVGCSVVLVKFQIPMRPTVRLNTFPVSSQITHA